jgi:P4 family phage/plasmid primase-like protien
MTDYNNMAELNYNEKKSLNHIYFVKNRNVKRTTDEERKKNVIVCDIDKAVETIKNGGTYHEFFMNDCLTKIYLDIEREYNEEVDEKEKNDILDACVGEINKIFEIDENFDAKRDIAVAQRHRWIKKGKIMKYKVSFRFWIVGYSIKYTQIPQLFKDYNVGVVPVINVPFDMSVYGNNQLLNCVCNWKIPNDKDYPLIPITNHEIKAFIAQYIGDARANINYPETTKPNEVKNETKNVEEDVENQKLKDTYILIDMLNADRADNYQTWMEVGWCLKNIDESLLCKWIKFSEQSYKYKEVECEKLWESMKKGNIGMGSLHMWAKQDNKKAYDDFMKFELRKEILKAKGGFDFDMANVVYKMYENKYAYDAKYETWYMFKHHRWMEMPKGLDLMKNIPTEVSDMFRSSISYFSDMAIKSQKEDDKEKYDNIVKNLHACIGKMKKTAFQKAVMEQLKMLFKVDDFTINLDEKPNLIGFTNGVYDLDEDIFREGRPEDMINKSTGYAYVPTINMSIRRKIMDFFTSIQDTEEMRDYLLDTLGINIHGDKKRQFVFFWVGEGGNGKGVCVVLYSGALGEYCYQPSIDIFTKKKSSSSSASPEIAKVKGVRGCISTEPERDEVIYVGILKNWTGAKSDKLQGRPLYGQSIEFKPQSYPIIQMIMKPALSSDDGGIARRLRLITFPYNFVDNPTRPHEKKIDLTLETTFTDEEYYQQFMLVMIERYRAYKNNGYDIYTPEKVLNETKEYLNENNHVQNFIDECYEKDPEYLVQSSVISMDFKKWCKDNHINVQYKKSDFNALLKKCGYEVVKKTDRGLFHNCMVIYGIRGKYEIMNDEKDELN